MQAHLCANNETPEQKSQLFLTFSIYLFCIHNIPEGLSVGIAFGVALANPDNHALLIGPSSSALSS